MNSVYKYFSPGLYFIRAISIVLIWKNTKRNVATGGLGPGSKLIIYCFQILPTSQNSVQKLCTVRMISVHRASNFYLDNPSMESVALLLTPFLCQSSQKIIIEITIHRLHSYPADSQFIIIGIHETDFKHVG